MLCEELVVPGSRRPTLPVCLLLKHVVQHHLVSSTRRAAVRRVEQPRPAPSRGATRIDLLPASRLELVRSAAAKGERPNLIRRRGHTDTEPCGMSV